MGYDLYLSVGKTAKVRQWFESRAHYQLSDMQAVYENEATGVYFTFDFDGKTLAFRLNFFRPSFFGLEAEVELSAFVDAFAPKIDDPQEMGKGPYSGKAFLRGWNHGNLAAYRAIEGRAARPSLPTKILHDVWRWNYAKAAHQQLVGDHLFVPSIFFIERPEEPGRVLRATVWDRALPVVMPEVDAFVMFGASIQLVWKKDLDLSAYPVAKAKKITVEGVRYTIPPCARLAYDTPPKKLSAALAKRAFDGPHRRLAADSVLDHLDD